MLRAEALADRSDLLRHVGGKDEAFTVPTGRGDEANHGGGPDARDAPLRKARDIFIPDLRLGEPIDMKARNFR